MAGKFSFTLQEYKDAARKYRSDFLRLPIIGCEETLKFMTGRPGIRYKESVGTLTAGAQFAPYKPSRKTDANLKLDYRTLETFFGSVVANFEPNSAVSLAWHRCHQGRRTEVYAHSSRGVGTNCQVAL